MTDEKKRKVWTAFMKEFSAKLKECLTREGISVKIHDRGFSKSGVSLGFLDFSETDRKQVERAYDKLHGEIFRQYADEYKEIFQR